MKSYLILILALLTFMSIYSLTIYDVQYTEYLNGASRYENEIVTLSGIVTRVLGTDYAYIQDDTLPWHGLLIYRPTNTFKEGDEISVTGKIVEYFNPDYATRGVTEISVPSSMSLLSSGNSNPGPTILKSGLVADEKYEAMYIQINNAVVENVATDGKSWIINDGSGSLTVYKDKNYPITTPVSTGDTLLFIRGFIDDYNGKFELKPYANSDVLTTLNGSGTAKANPKYVSDSSYIGVRVDIMPTVDSLYGIVKYIKMTVPANIFPESVFVLCDSVRLGLDSLSVVVDTTSNSTTIEINNVLLLDTIKIYMKDYYFTADDTIKVYTGIDSTFLSLVSELPVIRKMPDYDILDIEEVQSTFDGYTSKYIDQLVTVKGVVTGPSEIFTPTSSSTGFWMQDTTAGVNIYSTADPMDYSFTLGSEIILTGTVTEYNGVTEIKYSSISDVLFINDTIAEVAPEVLSESQGISELNEGSLVKIKYGKILTTPVDAGTGKNFQVQNGMSVIDVRVSESTGLYSNPIMTMIKPGTLIDVTGIAGQYDSEAPYTAGYQLLVRFENDMQLIQNEEDSTFSLKIFPNPVMFDYGQVARIEVKGLNTDKFTVKIFDINGKLIQNLAENQSGSMTLIWNGNSYSGKRVDIGAYVVMVYKVNADGYRKSIAKPIIVSTKLK